MNVSSFKFASIRIPGIFNPPPSYLEFSALSSPTTRPLENVALGLSRPILTVQLAQPCHFHKISLEAGWQWFPIPGAL